LKVKLLSFVITLLFVACNSESTFHRGSYVDNSLFDKLVQEEIQKTIKLNCDFKESYGVDRNLCFYNDTGLVQVIEAYRHRICEEMTHNPPPNCITHKTIYAYYSEYYEECTFKWSSLNRKYLFNDCKSYEHSDYENLVSERLRMQLNDNIIVE
jgi:hypothetical protein